MPYREEWAVAYAFQGDRIVLAERPSGGLNGIGVEVGNEDGGPGTALSAAFEEVTGVLVFPGTWVHFETLYNEGVVIECYTVQLGDVEIEGRAEAYEGQPDGIEPVALWLVTMARDEIAQES